jgi:hypothetical protein
VNAIFVGSVGAGRLEREGGLPEQVVGAWCRADREVDPGETRCTAGICTGREPEFRRVIGEGFRVAHDQLVVARPRQSTPLAGFLPSSELAQDAGELRRVVRIIRGDRQRV